MKISEAESKVLEVFWRAAGPLTAEEVVAAMDNDRDWSAGTIRTFRSPTICINCITV